MFISTGAVGFFFLLLSTGARVMVCIFDPTENMDRYVQGVFTLYIPIHLKI